MEIRKEASASLKNMDKGSEISKYEVINQIDREIGKGDYRAAFRLFRNRIIGILCREGMLEVCSPYYYRGGQIKEDKVISEFVGVYEYYYATNKGYRSLRPNGDPFRCGGATASFLGAVKEYLGLLAESPGDDPLDVFNNYVGNGYYDLENYLEQAGVYGFSHNRRSRKITSEVLDPYVKKYYGNMETAEFIEWYQAMDRAYTTYGFPFACTHAGWFFEGYDGLYRKVFNEGVWVLHDFWQQEIPSDWLKKEMDPYPGIQPTYKGLLVKPGYQSLLCRLFPFRLTEYTLGPGRGMDSDEWEAFTLNLAKALHFSESCGRKYLPDGMLQEALKALEEVLEKFWKFGNNL